MTLAELLLLQESQQDTLPEFEDVFRQKFKNLLSNSLNNNFKKENNMSNFIKYKNQKHRINLDLVTDYYPYKDNDIYFRHPSMNDNEQLDSFWCFDTKLERDQVLNLIDQKVI